MTGRVSLRGRRREECQVLPRLTMQDGDAEPHTLVKYLELPLSIRLDCF
jgi:hypothetical protein